MPLYTVPSQRFVEALPQIDVLDRLLVGGLPAIALPAVDPFHDAVAQILAVCVDIDQARTLERLQRRDRAHQLHPVVGSVRLAAHQFFGAVAEGEDCAPGPGAGTARPGAAGTDAHVRL